MVTKAFPIRFLMLEGEQNLIERAKQGETSCFSELYFHYIPAIYRFIYMKVSHKEEAEDLTHEVFLSAWQNLDRYEARGFPFSSWLYQIARNRVIDHYRLKKPNVDLERVDAELVKFDSGIETNLDTGLRLDLVKTALLKLTEDQQNVIIMKFIEDLSHREIAYALGKSEGAVRLIQHRAINALKKALGN